MESHRESTLRQSDITVEQALRDLRNNPAQVRCGEVEGLKRQVMNALKNRPMTRSEIAQALNMEPESIREAIWQLIQYEQVGFTADWKMEFMQGSASCQCEKE